MQGNHLAPIPIMYSGDRMQSKSSCQYPVKCSWTATTLNMTKNRGTRLFTRLLLNLISQPLTYSR